MGRVTNPASLAPVETTDRVVMRPWTLDDADRLYDMRRRWEVVKWIGGQQMRDRREAVAWIEEQAARLAADPRFGMWAVVERSSGIPAGTVVLQPLPGGDGEVEIGWHFHPDSWGRGLATEAGLAMRQRGFAVGLEELWAVTDLRNHRSAAVCGRLGMRLLGVTHRWYPKPSLMFWIGARADQKPSLAPDEPAPAQP
jgi:RimJ/RimL family protein N-acetyltransferase